MRSILEIGKGQGTIQDYRLPGWEAFQGNVRRWIKHVAWGHHACGTCKIGTDKDDKAVLDGDFRVRGVENLRVVDASAVPDIPGFFIVTSIYMMSEKASDVILADRRRPAARTWPRSAVPM